MVYPTKSLASVGLTQARPNKYVNIPMADTGDCTEGVTVTVIGVLEVPPIILTITSINPDDSEPVNCPDANPTTNTSNQTILDNVTFIIKMYTYW